MSDPSDSAPVEPSGGRSAGAWGFALVLSVVLLLLILGSRDEITRSWGLSGEPGELLVEGCWSEQTEQGRSRCRGLFVPDVGGEPYVVEALVNSQAGDRLRVGADGPDELAYRADLWGRWAAVALPLLPLSLLWVLPWARWMLRQPGRASRRGIVAFLGIGVAPFAVLALLGAVGFFVAIAIT